MRVVIRKSSATQRVADGIIPHRTMKDELEAIENYGEEMPPTADESQYMFKDASEVDMDAYCDPNVDLQKLGVSVDEHTYFGEVLDRLGLDKPQTPPSPPVVEPQS